MNLPLIFGLLLATGVGLILSSVLNTRSISFSDRVASQLRGETLRESLLRSRSAVSRACWRRFRRSARRFCVRCLRR